MKFGQVHCGGCEIVLGHFPVDNKPKEIELYCEGCKEKLEDEHDLKEELNGQN